MRRWLQVASIGIAILLLLVGPSGLRVQGGEGDIIPPSEFSATGDPLPEGVPLKNRQDEPSVALNPTDAKKLSFGFNDWSREPQCTNTTPSDCSSRPGISLSGIARSTDGGFSFACKGSVQLSPPNSGGPFPFGDPSLAYDRNGNLYYGTIGFPSTTALTNADFFVAKFTDGTCTNTSFADVSGNVKFDDKPWVAVDTNPNSPCLNNVYGVWSELPHPNKIMFARSSDGGATWGKKSLSPGNNVGRNGAFVKADNGNVWVVWFDVRRGQPQQHMAISNDCGKKFDKHITVATVIPVGSPYPGASFRVNSLPSLAVAPDGITLYVAWADLNNGRPVIKVAKSTTKGLTWNDPVVAGDVTQLRFTKNQAFSAFFPSVDVDPTNSQVVNLAFLGLETKAAGTAPGKNVAHYLMFVRQSTDGGATWSDPNGGTGFGQCCSGDDPDASTTDDLKFQFLGDYITAVSVPAVSGISGGLRRFLVAWTDTSTAQTCKAVDDFRAGTVSKPNVITQCVAPPATSPHFGNTDVLLTEAFTY